MLYLRIGFRNLLQAPIRTTLLSIALGIVTMLLVMLLALSQGITDTMVRAATTLSAGHVNVAGFYKAKPTDAIPIVTGAAKVREIVTEKTPYLDFVLDRQRGWGRLVSDTSSLYTGISGITLSEEKGLVDVIQLAKESEYWEGGRDEVVGDVQALGEPGTAMIFAGQARRLGVRVGDALTITTETADGATNTTEVRIVAIGRDLGFMTNWSAFVSKDTLQDLYQLAPDTTGAVQIYLTDPSKSEEVMGELRKVFAAEGYEIMDHVPQPFFMKFDSVSGEDWTGQRLDFTTWEDEVSFLQNILTAVDSLSFILLTILTVLIAVGIMNSLWIAVRDRTQEIGTLRAIGMRRMRVLKMFLTEALLLGLMATGIGATLGALIAGGLNALRIHIPVEAVQAVLMSDTLNMSVQPMQIGIAVGAFTLICGLSALWPAARAARMQPVTAIHHVG